MFNLLWNTNYYQGEKACDCNVIRILSIVFARILRSGSRAYAIETWLRIKRSKNRYKYSVDTYIIDLFREDSNP